MNPPAGVGGERQSIAAVFSELAGMTPGQRESAVRNLREQSPSLAAEVESLLAFHDDEGSILDRSPLVDAITPTDSSPLAPLSAESSLPGAGSVLGGAVLQATVGSGSRFVVYSAQADGGGPVAVKVVRPELVNSAMVQSFRRANTLTWPQHPSIARVHGVHSEVPAGAAAVRLFVVEEFVEGAMITDWAAEHCRGFVDRVSLVADMCEAVAAGHEAGVTHGHLAPSHIRVLGTAPAAMIKLTGFGVQRLFDEPLESVKGLGSSPAAAALRPGLSRLRGLSSWLAPEQRADRPGPTRPVVDVYALGMIAIEVLTGEAGSQLAQIRGRGATAIRQVIGQAVSQSPADRYPGAASMAQAVRRVIDDRSGSWWSRLSR